MVGVCPGHQGYISASLCFPSLSITEGSESCPTRLYHASSHPGKRRNYWHNLLIKAAGLMILPTFGLPLFPVCAGLRPSPLELAAWQPQSKGSALSSSFWQTAPLLQTAKHILFEIAHGGFLAPCLTNSDTNSMNEAFVALSNGLCVQRCPDI